MTTEQRAMGSASRHRLLATASAVGLVCFLFPSQGAFAQSSASASEADPEATQQRSETAAGDSGGSLLASAAKTTPASEEIIVTGSRAIRDGSKAPTPLTVLSAEQLNLAAPQSIADALTQVPVFPQSQRPTSAGSSGTGLNGNGGNFLNLRGLNPVRTLVLLDGRRTVQSNRLGSVDINTFPQLLVRRVDVVTGGASAAYGSDAVAGVVNFVLDTSYHGVKGEVQAGISNYGDAASYKAGIAVGNQFLDGRLSVIASAEFSNNDGVGLDYGGRKWAESGYGIIPNNTGGPTSILAPDIARSDSAVGGLITGSSALAGTQFGPGGVPIPFQYGAYRSASVMSGGDGPRSRTNLATKLKEQSYFAHGEMGFSDAVNLFAELSYSDVKTEFPATYPGNFGATGFTIFRDNAFLPTSIRDRMTTLGLASIPVGRFSSDWGIETDATHTRTFRIATGLKGGFGDNWRYNVYYTHGQTRSRLETRNDPIQINVYNGVDAVVNPANGQIVCRSTLTSPSNGCVPINIFGPGATSEAGIRYATGTAWADLTAKQDVFSATINGEPFSTWVGPVAVAFGGEYRKEKLNQVVDPISSSIKSNAGIRGVPASQVGSVGGFKETNPQPLSGSYSVKEAFGEIAVPLARDVRWAQSFDLNAAVRYADYSSVGGVVTWKVGAVYSPISSIRLRGTRSRDIRAPNISDLYTQAQQTTGVGVRDPRFGNSTAVVTRFATGNPNLTEETADTTTYGLVLEPRFLPGFTASIDRYEIKIRDAIAGIAIQQVVDSCAGGLDGFCDLVRRDPTTNVILSVTTPSLNIASLKTSGIDFEASYRTDMSALAANAPGSLSFRLLVTKIDKLVTIQPSGAIDRAGSLGQNDSVPDLLGSLSVLYSSPSWALFGQLRYINGGKYDSTLTPAQLNSNHVESRFYADMTITKKLQVAGGKVDAFLSVNNVFNQDPPVAPTGSVTTPRYTNGFLYDQIGRYFTAGLKFAF